MSNENLILEIIRKVESGVNRLEKKIDTHICDRKIHVYPTTLKEVGAFIGKSILLISLIVGISYNVVSIKQALEAKTKIIKEGKI